MVSTELPGNGSYNDFLISTGRPLVDEHGNQMPFDAEAFVAFNRKATAFRLAIAGELGVHPIVLHDSGPNRIIAEREREAAERAAREAAGGAAA